MQLIEVNIGEEIKAYRGRLGITQSQLAAHFEVSANTIARWERGEVVPEAVGMVRYALRGLELERGIDASGEIARLSAEVDHAHRRAERALAR